MFKELKIGAKKIGFLANGLTPLFYKQVFGTDLLKQLTESGKFEIAGDKIPELAYIMAKQAEKADMSTLNYDGYLAWLEGFEALDLVMNGQDVVKVYMANTVPSEKPKKKASAEAKE